MSSSRGSSASSFIYRSDAGGSPAKFLNFQEDQDIRSDSSDDDRYLETRLSDLEVDPTWRDSYTHPDQLQLARLNPDTDLDILPVNTQEHVEDNNLVTSSVRAIGDGSEDVTEDELAKRRELAKIKRLDRILSKKSKFARRVKRDHAMFQREMLDTIDSLNVDRNVSREESVNTSKYLSMVRHETLGACSGLDNGGRGDNPEDVEDDVMPIFETQPLFEERKPKHPRDETDDASEDAESRSTKTDQSRLDSDTDFIARNVKLAADAGNLVAMTTEERDRLDVLLGESQIEDDYGVTHSDYRQVCYTPTRATATSSEDCKDQRLRETREQRIAAIRMAHIDEKLRRLSETPQEVELSSYQLKSLIQNCESAVVSESGVLQSTELRALLEECRPEDDFSKWRHIDSRCALRTTLDSSDIAIMDTEVLTAFDDVSEENQSLLAIEYNVSELESLRRTRELSENIGQLESQSDQLLMRLTRLTNRGSAEVHTPLPEMLCIEYTDTMEHEEKIAELDQNMKVLREKLKHLQSYATDSYNLDT